MSGRSSQSQNVPKELALFDKISFLFSWTRIFYPRYRGTKLHYLFFYFFPQKILGINRFVPWPVHFTSKVLFAKRIKVGFNTAPGGSNGCYIQGRNGIVFGNNVRIGPGTGIVSANHDPDDYDKWLPSPPIEIGNNVWIGMNVVVTPGVRIGDNVLIGANSVVTTDIPSNSVAVGSPCKVIRSKDAYKGQTWD